MGSDKGGDLVSLSAQAIGAIIGGMSGGPGGALQGAQLGGQAAGMVGAKPSGKGGLGKTAQPGTNIAGAGRGITNAGGSGFNPQQGAGTMINAAQMLGLNNQSSNSNEDGLKTLSSLLKLTDLFGNKQNEQASTEMLKQPEVPKIPQPNIDISEILKSMLENTMLPVNFNQNQRMIGPRR